MTKKRTAAPKKPRRTVAKPAAQPDVAADGVVADVVPLVEAVAAAPAPEAMPAAPEPRVDVLDLGSSCALPDVAALRLACIAALEAKSPPVLDGSRVERVDAAGIQVLVGFTIDCMERSVDFSWAGRSPQLARAIRLLGVDALLESPGIATPMGGVA